MTSPHTGARSRAGWYPEGQEGGKELRQGGYRETFHVHTPDLNSGHAKSMKWRRRMSLGDAVDAESHAGALGNQEKGFYSCTETE